MADTLDEVLFLAKLRVAQVESLRGEEKNDEKMQPLTAKIKKQMMFQHLQMCKWMHQPKSVGASVKKEK